MRVRRVRMRASWIRWVGTGTIVAGRRTKRRRSSQTRGVCTTCTATCVSGARIGMTRDITIGRQRATRKDLIVVRAGWIVAVAGTATPCTVGPRAGTTATRRTRAAALASASSSSPLVHSHRVGETNERKGAMADARPRAESEKSRSDSPLRRVVVLGHPTECLAAGRVHHINYPPPFGRTPSKKQG